MSKPVKAPLLCVYPNTILNTKAIPVVDFDEKLQKKIELLRGVLRISKGVGIAANQCFLPDNIFIAIIDDVPTEFINAEVVDLSEATALSLEGCLSLPDASLQLPRHTEIEIKHQNLKGETFVTQFTGPNAIVVQHELDHLNGKLIVDYASKLRKDMILRHCKKVKKRYGLI